MARTYRETAARNWDESKDRILGQEQVHQSKLGLLKQRGYPDDHPSVLYHQDLLGQVQRERAHYDSWLQPREGQAPTIEAGMERQARAGLNKRDDDED
jgi:hypothetical protein